MFSLPVKQNVSLKEHTTIKIGGPADYFFIAKNIEDIKIVISEARQNKLDYFILGNGSNVLIADAGFKGLVIKLDLKRTNFNNNVVTVQSGVLISELLSKCKDQGLSGLEFLAGVPATIGGAVWANAGAVAKNIGSIVQSVTVLDTNNEIKELSQALCKFGYRDSIFKKEKYIILEARLKLEQKNKQEIEAAIKENIMNKIDVQDMKSPSSGSIFKNPKGERKAWELIKEVELCGKQIGGAKISDKHCNFIINTGNATASDVIMLISLIKQKVRDNLGIQLMEEVEYVGLNN